MGFSLGPVTSLRSSSFATDGGDPKQELGIEEKG